MNLALSSDFPSTANSDLVDRIRSVDRSPRIAWLAPAGPSARVRFPLARVAFLARGFTHLERVDLDADRKEPVDGVLGRYDVVYLSGGDPVVLRQDLQRSGFDVALREFAASGRLIVGASGGAMQLTRNVSLYRLLFRSVDDVVCDRAGFDGLGLVGYEILPHLNRHDAAFQETVRRYSERIAHDVVALADGAVAFCDGEGDCRCFGQAVRYRRGIPGPIGLSV